MAKAKLPLSLITSYINQAWSTIDSINADIVASKKEYSGTDEFVDCLQSVSDAYLILAGRLQKYLDEKNYIEFPKEEQVKESLEENLVVSVENTETGDVVEVADLDLDDLESFFNQDNSEEEIEEKLEDTAKNKKKLINEAPDKYGLPTDDELEAEKKKRLADLEKEFNDKKQNIHTQRTQFDNEEIKIKNLTQEFYNKVGKKIQQFVEDIKQGKYLEFYSYIRNDDIKEVGFKEGKMSFKFDDNYIVVYEVKTHRIWWSNPRSGVLQRLPFIMNNLDKYLWIIKDQNEQSRINATNNRQLMSLFKNPNLLTSIRLSDNPGHWAHGCRFCVFSYNGKIYSYEDYDSGAYSGNHCHQLREFNQIGLDEDHANSYYDYTCPVIQEIDPAQVGLKVKKDSYGITVDGQIDLTLLDKLTGGNGVTVDMNDTVKEESLHEEVEDKETEKEDEFPTDFEDIVDLLKADEDEAIDSYDKAMDNVEDDFVKDQLDKISSEEKAHKDYLDKVVDDPTTEYIDPSDDDDDDDEDDDEEDFSMKDDDDKEDFDIISSDFPSPTLTAITDDDLYSQD